MPLKVPQIIYQHLYKATGLLLIRPYVGQECHTKTDQIPAISPKIGQPMSRRSCALMIFSGSAVSALFIVHLYCMLDRGALFNQCEIRHRPPFSRPRVPFPSLF